jgi:predicted SnoaL-like aldol condensation-catalyzing enzyme
MPDQAKPAAQPEPARSADLLSAGVPPASLPAVHPTRAADVHRRLVELYRGLLATGQFDAGLALIDPDVIDHRGGTDGDHRGRSAWRQKWERLAAGGYGVTDMSVTIEQNVAAGDISVNRYTSRGTDPATGRSYAVTSMDMVRVRDGRVVEHWAVMDSTARRHQLSAAPADQHLRAPVGSVGNQVD